MNRDKENHYTLAVKFSKEYSVVAYKTAHTQPTVLDRTGGYGQVKVPLIIAWLVEDETWLIGREAMALSADEGPVFEGLIEGCIRNEVGTVSGKALSYSHLLAVYAEQLAEELSHINPYAVLEEIRVLLPEEVNHSIGEAIYDELKQRFACKICQLKAIDAGVAWIKSVTNKKSTKFLWINYGSDGLQAYVVATENKISAAQVLLTNKSAENDILIDLSKSIEEMYQDYKGKKTIDAETAIMIRRMAETYMPYVFKKQQTGQSLKLTFNQVFPPFQSVLTYEQLTDMTRPYVESLEESLRYLWREHNDSTMILTGEGFRMQWPYQLVQRITENHPSLCVEGEVFGLLFYEADAIDLSDEKVFEAPIGLSLGDHGQSFYTLAEKGERMIGFNKRVELIITEEEQVIRVVKEKDQSTYEVIGSCKVQPSNDEEICRVALNVAMNDQLKLVLRIDYIGL